MVTGQEERGGRPNREAIKSARMKSVHCMSEPIRSFPEPDTQGVIWAASSLHPLSELSFGGIPSCYEDIPGKPRLQRSTLLYATVDTFLLPQTLSHLEIEKYNKKATRIGCLKYSRLVQSQSRVDVTPANA